LTKWKQRLTLVGAAMQAWLIRAAARCDPSTPEGKKELNRLAFLAFIAAGGEDSQKRGTWLHALSEYRDRGEELPPHSDEDAADLAAYTEATQELFTAHIETPLVLNEYGIAGTADRLVWTELCYPGEGPAGWVVADLKTGSIDLAALKIAMQMAAYSRARRYDPLRWLPENPSEAEIAAWRQREFTEAEAAEAYLPTPEINPRRGLVIHLPAGSGTCTLHWIDLQTGWDALATAADVRSLRGRRNLLTPVETPGCTTGPRALLSTLIKSELL
jgi:hypothetical protein